MTRLRAIAPILVAAALTAVAVATANGAGCDDPGHYELQGDSWVLIGGCVAPGDLVVPDPVPPTPVADAAGTQTKG